MYICVYFCFTPDSVCVHFPLYLNAYIEHLIATPLINM